MPVAIDTLNIYSRIKSTGLSEESAKEIAEVFRQTVDENLANKIDLEQVKNELKKDIEQLRSEVKKEIEQLRAEVKKDIEQLRSKVKKEIEQLKSELKRDIEQLRSEGKNDIELLRSELKKDIAESKAGIIRWVAGMLVAQAALIAALVKLF